MTVKFRDPISAQACVLVSAPYYPFAHGYSACNYRKCKVDSSMDDALKRPSITVKSASNAVIPTTT